MKQDKVAETPFFYLDYEMLIAIYFQKVFYFVINFTVHVNLKGIYLFFFCLFETWKTALLLKIILILHKYVFFIENGVSLWHYYNTSWQFNYFFITINGTLFDS